MVLTDRDVIRGTETDEELLIFDVSDDALERVSGVTDGQATLVYGTVILGNCGCPCIE
jgi:hypothetical protein